MRKISVRIVYRLERVCNYAAVRRANSKRREVKLVLTTLSGVRFYRFAGFPLALAAATRIFRGYAADYFISQLERVR
jgi:hypothetical protein